MRFNFDDLKTFLSMKSVRNTIKDNTDGFVSEVKYKTKHTADDLKWEATFAYENFADRCAEQWYTFIEHAFQEVIFAVLAFIVWATLGHFMTAGFVTFVTLLVPAGLCIWFLLRVIINIFIMGLRILGSKINFLD